MASTADNRQFFLRYVDAISGKPKPLEAIQQFVSDPALITHILESEAAFPEYNLAIDDLVVENDTIALHGVFQGTQKGPFAGIPPTGRRVAVPVMLFYRIAGGKISQHWMQMDGASLMQQLTAAA